MKSWYALNRAGPGVGEISILSDIGTGGVTAKDFIADMKALGPVTRLNISISSNGGDVSEGFAIYNALRAHRAQKTVTILGLAASMASVIAMAGQKIRMPANSMLMIHEPFGVAAGGAEQLRSFGDALDSMRSQIAQAYTKRTGQSESKVRSMMRAETWLTADEAVELGFADEVVDELQIAAHVDTSKFKHPPKPGAASGSALKPLIAKMWRGEALSDAEKKKLFSKFNAGRTANEGSNNG